MEKRNRVALTIGSFDMPHLGHAKLFKECEKFADEVIVGLNSDAFIKQYKKIEPLFSYEEREALIQKLGYYVVRNDGPGRECILEVKPDVVVVGSDWARRDYYAQTDTSPDFFDDNNISLVYVPYTKGISATELKRRVHEQY